MKSLIAAVVLLAAAVPAMAAGGHCDEDIAAVDKALAAAKLSDADVAAVKSARDGAEAAHKASKFEECEKELEPAQKLLGIKDKHGH